MWIRNRHHHSDGDFAGPDGYGRHYRHGSVKLQEYITAYRVSKAQQDCAYLEQLYKERQQEYYVAQQNYANYMDANKGVVLQSALTERERLQNDMNLAYQVYSQVATNCRWHGPKYRRPNLYLPLWNLPVCRCCLREPARR